MKHKNLLNIVGMIVTLLAFVLIAIAIALDVTFLFFTAVGVLLVGVVLSSIIPSYIISKWQKMMLEHGVPTRARLANITVLGGRFGDIRLDFITEDDITTSAYVSKLDKCKFELDQTYDIRYNPADTEICLIMNPSDVVTTKPNPLPPAEPTQTNQTANAETPQQEELQKEVASENNSAGKAEECKQDVSGDAE